MKTKEEYSYPICSSVLYLSAQLAFDNGKLFIENDDCIYKYLCQNKMELILNWLCFKFEFYNSVDEIANISLTTQSLDFVGSNLFISGNNNVLSGSVTIGGGIVMQGFRAS